MQLSVQSFYSLVIILLLLPACKNSSKKPVPKPQSIAHAIDTAAVARLSQLEKAVSTPDYDTSQWTELTTLNTAFQLDLKYAGTDNFVKEKMYDCPRCFLRPTAARALLKIHEQLQQKGYGLKLFDCYRPLSIQKKLWQKIPNPSYVTNPKKGSMHNRGLAVDLTLTDKDGKELDMGTPFDFFGRKAHHTHTDLPQEVLDRRQLLKSTMEAAGFKSIRTEWWHYSYRNAKHPVANMVWKCE